MYKSCIRSSAPPWADFAQESSAFQGHQSGCSCRWPKLDPSVQEFSYPCLPIACALSEQTNKFDRNTTRSLGQSNSCQMLAAWQCVNQKMHYVRESYCSKKGAVRKDGMSFFQINLWFRHKSKKRTLLGKKHKSLQFTAIVVSLSSFSTTENNRRIFTFLLLEIHIHIHVQIHIHIHVHMHLYACTYVSGYLYIYIMYILLMYFILQ